MDVITLGGKGVADFEYDLISLASHIRPGIGTCGWTAPALPCHLGQEDHPSATVPRRDKRMLDLRQFPLRVRTGKIAQ